MNRRRVPRTRPGASRIGPALFPYNPDSFAARPRYRVAHHGVPGLPGRSVPTENGSAPALPFFRRRKPVRRSVRCDRSIPAFYSVMTVSPMLFGVFGRTGKHEGNRVPDTDNADAEIPGVPTPESTLYKKNREGRKTFSGNSTCCRRRPLPGRPVRRRRAPSRPAATVSESGATAVRTAISHAGRCRCRGLPGTAGRCPEQAIR